eukprot:6123632-Amphidinium_carterae.1
MHAKSFGRRCRVHFASSRTAVALAKNLAQLEHPGEGSERCPSERSHATWQEQQRNKKRQPIPIRTEEKQK